jgi:phage shock protein PspC (stress-responsive transcriptional regulator)
MGKKRLTKGTDKKLSGVCSGIAEYFGWDTTLTRVGTCLLAACCPTVLIAYFIAVIVMPNQFEK